MKKSNRKPKKLTAKKSVVPFKAKSRPAKPKAGRRGKAPRLVRPKRGSAPEVVVRVEPLPQGEPLDLGPIRLPSDGAEALNVLRELAELNDDALKAQHRHEVSAKQTKRLKTEWEQLAQALSKRLRSATHEASLPLFDQGERDEDMARAVENQIPGGDVDGGETAQAFAGEANGTPSMLDDVPF